MLEVPDLSNHYTPHNLIVLGPGTTRYRIVVSDSISF